MAQSGHGEIMNTARLVMGQLLIGGYRFRQSELRMLLQFLQDIVIQQL